MKNKVCLIIFLAILLIGIGLIAYPSFSDFINRQFAYQTITEYRDVVGQKDIEEMKAEQGDSFSLERINLAELERRTGVSRSRLRRLKRNGFQDLPRSTKGSRHKVTKLSGYTGLLDSLLRQGVKNSSVVLERLKQAGFEGGATIVKEYIAAHKHLIPAKRQLVAPQGNRDRRYVTKPGEAYQMDWGFADVLDYNSQTCRVACFAMICHHCGQRYIEFFPNAR